MSKVRCMTCRYQGVVVVPQPPAADAPAAPREVSVCRMSPPQAFVVPSPQYGPQALTIWPQVDPSTDYCGAHCLAEGGDSIGGASHSAVLPS